MNAWRNTNDIDIIRFNRDTHMQAFHFDKQIVQTDHFDGPLELLLYLVRRQGVDVKDINLADITDSYLQALETMQVMNLDTAGDFLLIAATLCFIKSQDVLGIRFPTPTVIDDEPSPQDVQDRLRLQIMEYERCKEAAENLSKRPKLNRNIFARPNLNTKNESPRVTTHVDAEGLLHIFHKLVKENLKEDSLLLERSPYSIADMAQWVVDELKSGPSTFKRLFQHHSEKSTRIVCFLATLELIRLQYVHVSQGEHFAPIHLSNTYLPDLPPIKILIGEL